MNEVSPALTSGFDSGSGESPSARERMYIMVPPASMGTCPREMMPSAADSASRKNSAAE